MQLSTRVLYILSTFNWYKCPPCTCEDATVLKTFLNEDGNKYTNIAMKIYVALSFN